MHELILEKNPVNRFIKLAGLQCVILLKNTLLYCYYCYCNF